MARFGLFGKLPSVGDFVGRGFSRDLRDGLDRLLQSVIGSATSEGATRESLERTSTALVLAIRPGALAATGFSGCVVPSCDRVGRFFPLCVGVELPMPSPGTARLALEWPTLTYATALCGAVFQGQSDNLTAPDLLLQVEASLGEDQETPGAAPFSLASDITLPPLNPAAVHFMFEGPEARMSEADVGICAQLPLMAEMIGTALTTGSGFDRFLAVRSMLDWTPLAALFDQRWAHWGWRVSNLPALLPDDEETVFPNSDEASDIPTSADAQPPGPSGLGETAT